MKVTITIGKKTHRVTAVEGQSVLALLQAQQITGVPAPCGGMGRCGKCRVYVEGLGEVLACQTPVQPEMHVFLQEDKPSEIVEYGKKCNHYSPDGEELLVAACDIGTTTVVCHLIDGKTGEILDTESAANEQKIYGSDVVTRIEKAASGQLEPMHHTIVQQISAMLERLCERCGRGAKIDRLAVAGNTVMCHLLVGISPESIGVAPFTPKELFGTEYRGAEIGIACCKSVYVLPCVSGYVGADITADVLAVVPSISDGQVLLLDIGTNGEMLLGNPKDGYVCCATAAGPAFEGAEIAMGMPAVKGAIAGVSRSENGITVSTIGETKAIGICGSGLLDALAILLETGLMDETGMLREKDEIPEPYQRYVGSYEGQACVCLTEEVCVTQEDIRNLQLAKAAIAAGIEVLLKEQNLRYEEITSVLIAGGFGSYMDTKSAAALGMIPQTLLPVTETVGNAAGEGAVMAAVSGEARRQLAEIQNKMRHLELSVHPAFSDMYMECINFEPM